METCPCRSEGRGWWQHHLLTRPTTGRNNGQNQQIRKSSETDAGHFQRDRGAVGYRLHSPSRRGICPVARQATATLCRQRPSPLATGQLKTWACGIVYALGFVNFLFDKSQTPSMSAAELCAAFGVSKSTGAAKAKAVREALGMSQMDPQWYRPSKMEHNSLAWMIMVNGFIVDVRSMPRDIQEAAYAKGLIPYLPEPRPRHG